MVFSSIPVFVDPPNWHQQANLPQANGGSDTSTQLLPPLAAQQHHVIGGGSVGSVGSIRPGSMADQARLAKIRPPETALKCPRCESTNTKFCYFNNYSLTQPRHFCKTCRRYWTRGGALRNVPVGGGCRRNKKNKRGRSKSPASNSEKPQTQTLSSPSSGIPNNSGGVGGSTHHELHHLPQHPHNNNNLPFMASLHNLNRYAIGNMGLGLHAQSDHNMGFQIGNSGAAGGMDQWRFQQIPFLSGFDQSTSSPAASSYPFQSDQGIEAGSGLVIGDLATGSRVSHQLPHVKMEETNAAINLSRSPLNVSENNQYYSWTDMSGLASSSTSHLL
ncbi:hypothetical protein RJT34_30018 [Clitoria ternatea]|uniref:Dof zinc finger protein n=1 Tax=Clitoria ternatea TaxID=43366 RepID=A0AAN9ETR7_CLITE